MKSLLIFNTFQQISTNISPFEFFLISNFVIFSSFFGVIWMQKNLVVIFMCIELIIVALAFNFILISFFYAGAFGLIFGYILLITAGAESALALSILTSYFFIEQHINVEFVSRLKG